MNEKYQMKHGKKESYWKLVVVFISGMAVIAIAFLIYLYFPVMLRFINEEVLTLFNNNEGTVVEENVNEGNNNNMEESETEIIAEEDITELDISEEDISENTEEIIEEYEEDTMQEDICGQNDTAGIVWSGLGIGIFHTDVDYYIDALLASGFTEIRIDIPDYQNTEWLNSSKSAVLKAISRGARVIWGVSSNGRNNPDYTITSENWPDFRQAILDNAEWAQDNGVYEFQLGNEECYHNDNTTMTDEQVRENIRILSTEVQDIFANGKISYSTPQEFASQWISEGIGDLDIIAANIYLGGSDTPYGNSYQDIVQNMINRFGTQGFYITEFAPSYTALNHYSSDEAAQAEAIREMIVFFRDAGLTRAFFFTLHDNRLGIIRNNGDCRPLIWEALTKIEKPEEK